MATRPAPEEIANAIAQFFLKQGRRPNEILMRGMVDLHCAKLGLSADEIAAGIAYGVNQGWFESIENNMQLKITESGYAIA